MPAAAVPFLPLARLDARAVIDILVIACLVYYLLKPLRGLRIAQILLTIVLLVLVYQGARWAQLEMVEWLLSSLLPYLGIALLILFQSEIRRALAHLARTFNLARISSSGSASAYDDIALAAAYFSQNRIGALIAFERDVALRTYIESGIPLDANLSYDLLLAIFRPGSPLHDGAVIVRGQRIAAASCFLPLSVNPMISNQLGTRHRAAIGVTEDSDAIAVLVSEQTGAISLAAGGTIELDLTAEQLTERLTGSFRRFRRTMVLPAPGPGARIAGKRRLMRLLRKFVLHNAGLKLLALAISITLWVTYAPEPLEVGYDVPIAFGHAPLDLAVTDAPTAVHLLVRGRAILMRRINPGDLSFTVDLSHVSPGETLVRLTPEMAAVPYGTEVVGLAPATLRISWVPTATSRAQ